MKINRVYFKTRLSYMAQTRTTLVLFALYCLQCIDCQKEVVRINAHVRTTLSDVVLYQFNTYSFLHLIFIPIYICTLCQFIRMGKVNEFIISRFSSRKQLIRETEKELIVFAGLYRCIEILITSIIFVGSTVITKTPIFPMLSLSPVIKKMMCIDVNSVSQGILVCIAAQVIVFFVYIFFAELVVLSIEIMRLPFLGVCIPLSVDIILLALLKADYWFDQSGIQSLLPHRNIFLYYIFDKGFKNYNQLNFGYASIYWILIIVVLYICASKVVESKNYLYQEEHGESN